MVSLTKKMNFIVTNTEIEALLIECNLIKQHKPRFNIILRDDKSFLKTHLKDADIAYHLAGITDVAYVKKDSNQKQDEKIKTIAIEGTRNVLNSINKKCKLIYPSRMSVFYKMFRMYWSH